MTKRGNEFDSQAFIGSFRDGRTQLSIERDKAVYSQGDAADAVFYVLEGRVKLTVVSIQGKEAIIGILQRGDFFGEAVLVGQSVRLMTATTMADSEILRLEKSAMIRALHDKPIFSESFLAYILTRSVRIEADLVDQLFNSSEKRLARMLLLLARVGVEDKLEPISVKLSQEALAGMIGTTRSRVSFFMNKFRKLGLIEYQSTGDLRVRSSLVNIVIHD